MSRLDDVQAAHETVDGFVRAAPIVPELAVEHAAVPGLVAIARAAHDLYERVEMDESVGICLSERVPSLRLGSALAEFEAGP